MLVLLPLTICSVVPSAGCFWQKDWYTQKMERGFATYAIRKELDDLLGPNFQPAVEFPVIFRPIKVTEPKGVPEDRKDLLAWCQGGDPLVELIVMGSAGNESLAEFRRVAFEALQAKHGGPAPADFAEQPAQEDDSLYGGKITFEFFSIQTQRQVAGAQGAPPQAVAYNWLVYFTEDGQQKVMLAYVVPDSKYAELYPAVSRSRQSLAIGARVGVAQGGAPAGGNP
jgi:hypothetical protein